MVEDHSALAHRVRREYEHLIWYYRLKINPALIAIDGTLSGSWGQWCPVNRVIKLSAELFENYSWSMAIEILKHEIAHQIVTEVFQVADQHGPFFQRAAQLLAMANWATRAAIGRSDLIALENSQSISPREDKLLKRTEKLLALGQSDNPHEAQLAMQRVRDLYLSYNIDEIRSRQADEFISRHLPLDKKRLSSAYIQIIHILTEYYFVEAIQCDWYCPKAQSSFKGFDIMGARANVLMAEYVFRFLESRMEAAWHQHRLSCKTNGLRSRNSFLLGFIAGFKTQLASSTKRMLATAGAELVRLDDPLLKSFVKHRYPRIARSTYRLENSESGDFESGRQQGKSTRFSKPLSTSKTKSPIKLLPSRPG